MVEWKVAEDSGSCINSRLRLHCHTTTAPEVGLQQVADISPPIA
jgi:hypothetical protein